MPDLDESLRKAAVLISCLEETDAHGLLARVGPATAGRIRSALGVLGMVSAAERQGVIREFLQQRPVPDRGPEGVELDTDLARRLAQGAESKRSTPHHAAEDDRARKRLGFLLETEPDVVAAFLAQESPQTVAVVLSFLPRSRVSAFLRRLEPGFQRQVLTRLANLDNIEPACIDVVIDELRTWIDRQRTQSGSAGDDKPLCSAIAESHDTKEREPATADLPPYAAGGSAERREEFPTAEFRGEDSRTGLVFDDLIGLDDADLLRVLAAAPQETLSLALAGADDVLIDRITGTLPRRQSRRIKRSIRLQGPTRLQDIDAAKERIAEIARTVLRQ